MTELTTFSDSIKDVCTCKSCHQQTKNGNYYFEANFILGRIFKKGSNCENVWGFLANQDQTTNSEVFM